MTGSSLRTNGARRHGNLLFRVIVLASSVTLAAGCASFRVATDFDPSFAFGELESYAWLPDAPEQRLDVRLHNALIDGRIQGAVERKLAERGFEQVAPEEADFFVLHHAGLETGFTVRTTQTSHRYRRGGWSVGGTTHTNVREYERGTLMIDVLLPDRSLVWRGSTSARIRPSDSPERREGRINDAVDHILNRFPPK
jgi:hypothetical protein